MTSARKLSTAVALMQAVSLFGVAQRGPVMYDRQLTRGGLVTGSPRLMLRSNRRRHPGLPTTEADIAAMARAEEKRKRKADRLAKQVEAGGIERV